MLAFFSYDSQGTLKIMHEYIIFELFFFFH